MRLIWNCICWSIFFTGFISCNSKSSEKKTTQTTQQGGRQQGPQKVDVIIATPQKITQSIEVPGTLTASETTEIHPEVSGRVVQLNVREGSFVGKGALLAKLYDGDLHAQ